MVDFNGVLANNPHRRETLVSNPQAREAINRLDDITAMVWIAASESGIRRFIAKHLPAAQFFDIVGDPEYQVLSNAVRLE